MKEAKGKYLAILDSDGQIRADDLTPFLKKINNGANIVFGWRKPRHDPFFRILISRLFNFLGRLWFKSSLHDLNCGMRMFDREFIEACPIKYRINMVNPEMFVRAKNANLVIDEEIVRHSPRLGGETSHNLLAFWRIFLDVNLYFANLRKLRSE